jgi:hypothetical protein
MSKESLGRANVRTKRSLCERRAAGCANLLRPVAALWGRKLPVERTVPAKTDRRLDVAGNAGRAAVIGRTPTGFEHASLSL